MIGIVPGANRIILTTLLFFCPLLSRAGEVDSRYQEYTLRQKTLVSAGLSAKQLSDKTAISYSEFKQSLQNKVNLSRIPTSDLLLMFRAADEASFYTSSTEHASDMEAISRLLISRRAAESTTLIKTYFAYIAAREYKKAQQWRIAHNLSVDALDNEISQADVSRSPLGELRLGNDGVEYHSFKFPMGGFVLIVAHPHCHFSRDAVRDISNDIELGRRMDGRSKWISPQQREESLVEFREWNAVYTSAQISQAYLSASWQSVDTWETPTFYFFYNGILQEKIIGWPKEGRKAELNRALERLGLRNRAP